MWPLKYLVTGTGRCGTKFLSCLLTGVGVGCGHETIFNTWGCGYAERFAEKHPELVADSSWLAAACIQRGILEGTQIIHLVRHPRRVINSLLRTQFWTNDGVAGWRLAARNMLPTLDDWSELVDKSAHFYVEFNNFIEGHADYFHRIEDDPRLLLDAMGVTYDASTLFSDSRANAYEGERRDDVALADISQPLRDQVAEKLASYRYEEWGKDVPTFTIEIQHPEPGAEEGPAFVPPENPVVKAIITTLDNLPLLQEQIDILRDEPEISEIVVVNNGSIDGTKKWLETVSGVTVINRENEGAGPGRNSGLDAAGAFDYVLMVDGGIRPLRGSVRHMLDYLQAHPGVDAISPEVATCFSTDIDKAHRRMPEPIDEKTCFPQRMLSSTAYALCNSRAWEGLRFSEEGPFGEPGWGVDDNEMALRWDEAGILHHDFSGVLLYRRASGSWARLYRETGIYPNQYGSVYEKRVVKMYQDYPHQVNQWQGRRIEVSAVVLGWNEHPMFARAIKVIHDDLKDIPHEVIFVDNGSTDETKWWLDTHALRWHHGGTAIDAKTGEILKRCEENEATWTGNVVRVDLPENMGAGYGFNAGFDQAVGKYIFYLAGDILPTKGSIRAMKEYLDEHVDVSFACVNAWVSQKETEEVEFDGLRAPLGMGNYAYSYAMMRRGILDAGCRMADQGPFAGPGCGYEEAEFACQMYAKGFKCVTFIRPKYYHDARNFRRSGHEGNLGTALAERKHWLATRWQEDDLFAIVYHHEQPPKRHVRRVAVVNRMVEGRPGPAGHFAAALRTICEIEQFNPGEEPEGFDDYFYVDDGPSGYMEPAPHATVSHFWAIDFFVPRVWTSQPPETHLERAKNFDHYWVAQPSSTAYLRENGAETQTLLNAANPQWHRPHDEEVVYDWIALWHNCGERVAYAEAAAKAFPKGYVGYKGGEAYSQWMCRAKCSLNLSRANEIVMRVFETMATGVPLVADRARDMDQFFQDGEHYRGFSSVEEMLEQIQWVLDHPGEAAEMAQKARELVLAKHTYYHRALRVWGPR